MKYGTVNTYWLTLQRNNLKAYWNNVCISINYPVLLHNLALSCPPVPPPTHVVFNTGHNAEVANSDPEYVEGFISKRKGRRRIRSPGEEDAARRVERSSHSDISKSILHEKRPYLSGIAAFQWRCLSESKRLKTG